jgi:Anti-sigma factor NepR
MNIMSEKTKPEQAAIASSGDAPDNVPDWLGGRLRRMFSEVMDEPVPDEFKALLKQLEDKERGS